MRTHAGMLASRRAVLLGGAAAVLAGCTAEPDAEPSPEASTRSASPTEQPSAEPTEPEPSERPTDEYTTTVATSVVASLPVFAQPGDLDDRDADVDQERVLERAEEISGELVLLALETGRAWVHVQLPIRPNGTTGWVRARDVRLSRHSFAVEVFLSDHELVVTERGSEVLRTDVGVGRTDRPTPGGNYYIKELLAPPDPEGLYGPYAYGLSGFSTVFTEFYGGDAVIGIHGTDEPELVGQDVSSGCIRLPNEQIVALVEQIGLPLGTPVTITA
ncbi:L,D-transpeptidase [Ruania suaedae]|uniref:L,D-transpeptidase n=1 Tax=Ruania suaedae TaxID=2897774 RepID=UPI001E426FD8|nr:L,D-transpeptidase [Ruania suaedae]UFU02984.1 L,D-transpeptidase [Ruania suaedae]